MPERGITRQPVVIENRASKRRPTAAGCRIFDGRILRYTHLVDIGLGGVRVLTAGPPEVGTTVELRFELLPVTGAIEATGRVVWRTAGFGGRGGVMAIEFSHVAGASRISHFVERL